MRLKATAVALLVLVSTIGAAAAPVAAQDAEGEAYNGAHVQFDAGNNSVADYAVNGDVLVENVTMQSSSEARNQAGVGVDAGLETAADFRGAGLQMASRTSASATVQVDSGGEMQAHDNDRGVLQVRATDEAQMVRAQVSGEAEAESDGDDGERVVVEHDDGSQGAFLVVGDGNATVNDEGDVVAEVEQGSELVYRQYEGERDDNDEEAERMIQEGTATAEVYVQQAGDDAEGSGEEGRDTAVETIQYGQDTTVEVAEKSSERVEMTVERSESEGKVVLATVSEEAVSNAQELEVLVDGEAAAQADSYSAVEQSAQEGDQPRYYVAQSASASAATDVAIGIDHFSEREVTMNSGDGGGSTDGGSGDGDTDGDGAGFGVLAALAALAAALVAARRP